MSDPLFHPRGIEPLAGDGRSETEVEEYHGGEKAGTSVDERDGHSGGNGSVSHTSKAGRRARTVLIVHGRRRPKPAPTFQQTPPMRFPTPSPQPLTPSPHKRIEIMDSSFIGMSGGQVRSTSDACT